MASPPLASLRRGPLVDLAVEQLRGQVASGAWPVGSRLPTEIELAQQMQVARSTVREAIRVLAHSGLLAARQGSGTYVRARTPDDGWAARLRRAGLLDVYEVRQGIEVGAARLAAERRTDHDLARIDETLARRHAALADGRDEGFAEADVAFHQAVVTAAHNPLMQELFASFASALAEGLRTLLADRALAAVDGSDAHDELAAAIRAGDPERAARATAAHLDPVARELRHLLGAPGTGR